MTINNQITQTVHDTIKKIKTAMHQLEETQNDHDYDDLEYKRFREIAMHQLWVALENIKNNTYSDMEEFINSVRPE